MLLINLKIIHPNTMCKTDFRYKMTIWTFGLLNFSNYPFLKNFCLLNQKLAKAKRQNVTNFKGLKFYLKPRHLETSLSCLNCSVHLTFCYNVRPDQGGGQGLFD